MKTNILVTICARGGSKGVKGKNIRLLAGKPLIYYTIKQARAWGGGSHIIVSTDSPAIASVAQKYGAEVPFMRPTALASDTASKLSVLQHALSACEKLYKEKFPVIVDLDPTSPVRSSKDIEKVVQKLLHSHMNAVFSVVVARKNPYFNMVEVTAAGNVTLSKRLKREIVRRQDAPLVYDMNASIYAYKREYLVDPMTKSAVGSRSAVYRMDEWTSIDVDREMDFQFIEFLMKKGIIQL